jgi:hypothetical protein
MMPGMTAICYPFLNEMAGFARWDLRGRSAASERRNPACKMTLPKQPVTEKRKLGILIERFCRITAIEQVAALHTDTRTSSTQCSIKKRRIAPFF